MFVQDYFTLDTGARKAPAVENWDVHAGAETGSKPIVKMNIRVWANQDFNYRGQS